MTSVCYYCGNEPTADRPLVWDMDGRKAHKLFPEPPPDDASDETWDAALVPCPEPPAGWIACAICHHAVPASAAYAAEMRVQLEPRYRQSWTPTTNGAEPFWERVDRMPDGRNVEADELTRGVIVERDENAQPYAACAKCASTWPDDAKRRRYRVTAIRTAEPDSDETLASRVPAEGADVTGLMNVWGKADRATRDTARRLVASGLLYVTETPTRTGGAAKKTYVRAAR